MKLETVEANEEYINLALIGKMDIAGVASVEKEFLQALAEAKKSAIVDFSGVTFIGSMGLRTLLMAVRNQRDAGKKVVVLKPQPLVAEVLEASGIIDVLQVAVDLEQAKTLAKN